MATTTSKPTTQAEAWERFTAALAEEFPGHANQAMRRKILATVRDGGSVGLLGRTIAFTSCGQASLDAVARAAGDWQDFAFGITAAGPEDYAGDLD